MRRMLCTSAFQCGFLPFHQEILWVVDIHLSLFCPPFSAFEICLKEILNNNPLDGWSSVLSVIYKNTFSV